MRKLLNTLYVTNPESYLAREGENVLVRVDDNTVFRIPCHNLEAIVYFGYPGASPSLLGLCAERGITVSFLTEHGRFLARVEGPQSGNVLLRRRQYRLADEENQAPLLAKYFIAAKIINSRAVLLRGRRDHPEMLKTTLSKLSSSWARWRRRSLKATT